MAALVTYSCCVKKEGGGRQAATPLSHAESPLPALLSDELGTGLVGMLETKENPSYEMGTGKLEIKENVAYDQ